MPAIVTDLELSKIQWSMPGVRTSKAKELIVDKKYEELIKQSQKFSIDGDEYYGWKSNGQVMYKIIGEDDYLRVYVYTKEYE